MPAYRFLWIALLASAGCMSLRPTLRQPGPTADAVTQQWLKVVQKRGRDGDWLVIRGYQSTGHLVAVAGNAELSHVGVFDATHREVIEAVSPAVRSLSLREFLDEADRVVLIRPINADRKSGRLALARARAQIGAPYDLLGTLGLPEAGKFYCSELAAWSIGMDVDREGPAEVLHPAEMVRFGTVLFDSEHARN